MHTIIAALVYFAIVFGVGFAFGIVRTLWLVPRVGARIAELTELPIMLVVTVLAARWTLDHFEVPPMWSDRVLMGLMAAALLLAAEFGLVLRLRGLSVREYLRTRDPVSGTAYYLAVAFLAVLPVLLAR